MAMEEPENSSVKTSSNMLAEANGNFVISSEGGIGPVPYIDLIDANDRIWRVTVGIDGALSTELQDTTPPVLTITPAGGDFTNSQQITMSTDEIAMIYYTVDGTEPSTGSLVFSDPITITETTTIKAFARDEAGNESAITTVGFTKIGGEEPPTNLIPGFNSGSWDIHPDTTIISDTEIRLNATGIWHNNILFVPINPNQMYTFTVENPNGGAVYGYNVNSLDNRINQIFYSQSPVVTSEFTSHANASMFEVHVSSGLAASGTFTFKNPSLTTEGQVEPPPTGEGPFAKGDLRVSSNKRFLEHTNGEPFFMVADTAWNLFGRLNMTEIETYFETRNNQGFNTIMAPIIGFDNGFRGPNKAGLSPLNSNNWYSPNEAYFQFIDQAIQKAQSKGLYFMILPIWGSSQVNNGELNPSYNNQGLAEAKNKAWFLGNFLGSRYKNYPNIIWCMGGDTNLLGNTEIYTSMSEGLTNGDGGRFLQTYHTQFQTNDVQALYWIDFVMDQTGHVIDANSWQEVTNMYMASPTKPVIDGEPRYEGILNNYTVGPLLTDFDARQGIYWGLFAGAHGITYGHNAVWQMYQPGYSPFNGANIYWYDALNSQGGLDMGFIGKLMLSRGKKPGTTNDYSPFFSRIPDQSIIVNTSNGSAGAKVIATRGNELGGKGSYYLFYIPYAGTTVTINLEKLIGTLNVDKFTASWFNPRTGNSHFLLEDEIIGHYAFTSPTSDGSGRGFDWVLVIDVKNWGYGNPGVVS